MLSNRFFRLITAVVLGIVALIVGVFVLVPWAGQGVGVTVAASFAVAIVHQLCWDFLNFSLLDNFFGRLVKRLLFLAATLMAMLFCLSMFISDMETFFELDFFAKGVASAVSVAAPVTACICILSDRMDWDFEKAPFIFLMGIGVSVVLGLLMALLGDSLLEFVPYVLNVVLIVAAIVYMTKADLIYADYRPMASGSGYSSGRSYSSASRSSYSSSGSSSRSSSGSSRSSSYSSSSSSSRDYRKSDGVFLNQFSIEMHRIARNCSTVVSLSYGASMSVDVISSTSSSDVSFTINATINMNSSTASCESDVRTIANDRDKELQSIANDLADQADSAIDRLRGEYTDYDGEIGIKVKIGNIRVS